MDSSSIPFPMNRDELLSEGHFMQYGGLSSSDDDIERGWNNAKSDFDIDPIQSIKSHFSIFFHLVDPRSKCPSKRFEKIWRAFNDCLKLAAKSLTRINCPAVQNDTFESIYDQIEDSVRMYVYLACEYLLKSASIDTTTEPSGLARNRKVRDFNDRAHVIADLQIDTLSSLTDLIYCPVIVNLLKFRPSDQQFATTITRSYFIALETSRIVLLRDFQPIFDRGIAFVVQVLNNKTGLFPRIVQSLGNFPHTIQILVNTLVYVTGECPPQQRRTFISAMVKEIIDDRLGCVDQERRKLSLPSSKNIGQFLVEVCTKLPTEMCSQMGPLIELLGCEAHYMRTAIVNCFLEIYLRYLRTCDNGESDNSSLGSNSEETQHNIQICYGILTERVRDTNAFTRNAAVHAWNRMFTEKAIHFDQFVNASMCVADRFLDASGLVRKSSILAILSSMRNNPFSNNFNCVMVQKNLDKAVEMDELIKNKSDGEFVEDSSGQALDQKSVQKILQFWTQNSKFIEVLTNSLKFALTLLKFNSAADVCAAVDFIVYCVQSGLVRDRKSICTRIFELIWVKDAAVKRAAFDAFIQLYFPYDDSTAHDMAQSLIKAISEFDEFVSVGVIIAEIIKKEEVVRNGRRLDDKSMQEAFLNILYDEQSTQDEKLWAMSILRIVVLSTVRNNGFLTNKLEEITKYALTKANNLALRRECFALLVACKDLIVNRDRIVLPIFAW